MPCVRLDETYNRSLGVQLYSSNSREFKAPNPLEICFYINKSCALGSATTSRL